MNFKEYTQYLTEAHLGGKTTGGQSAWDKYIVNNVDLPGTQFHIENNVKDEPVYKDNGETTSTVVNAGMQIRILDKQTYSLKGLRGLFAKTDLGFINISKIRKPTTTNVLAAEQLAVTDLNTVLEKLDYPINVKIGKWTFKDIVSANSSEIHGDPKADIALIDKLGKEVAWISHKKAGGAAGFQQYGGVSHKSGIQHKEIDEFLRAVGKIIEKNRKLPHAVYREIRSADLINKSVYGPEYPGKFSRENVHCIGQGTPILEVKTDSNGDEYMELHFSEAMHINGDVSWAKKGKYLAVLTATFRRGRQFQVDGKIYKDARAMIAPILLVANRSGAKEI